MVTLEILRDETANIYLLRDDTGAPDILKDQAATLKSSEKLDGYT